MKRKIKLLNLLVWYKNLYENLAKQEFSLCQQAIEELKKRREEVNEEIVEGYQRINKKRVFRGEEIVNYFTELQNLREIKDKIEVELIHKEREREHLFEVLKGRYRERRLVEILRDKIEGLWEREEERRFLNEMNELVLLLRTHREKENI
ncbi:MAG: hypothetical protein NZ530_05695 [Thermodesulfobacteriaceae bacterium]|nr:hypothetical protein [Thermodesulfobacteriaceae bacterium]MDW8135889.1 hypothetical protein [Thermodesulfobacterium sp.]